MVPGYQVLNCIAKFLDRKEIEIEHLGKLGKWRLIHRISDKICQENHAYPYEAVTVYICEKVAVEDAGQRAIVKVRVEYVRLFMRRYGDSTELFQNPVDRRPEFKKNSNFLATLQGNQSSDYSGARLSGHVR